MNVDSTHLAIIGAARRFALGLFFQGLAEIGDAALIDTHAGMIVAIDGGKRN